MSKHASGPWIKIIHGGDFIIKGGGNGYTVFSIRDGVYPADSDLALILAAPELLETLEAILPSLTGTDLEWAVAAIAKATGGAQ